MKKRMLSLLLAVCLVVSMAPAAFAANGTTTAADTEKATTATEQGAKLYSDVPEDSWYVESVDTVTKNGYFNGYPDGTFKPSEAMTRAMFVTVISRMAKAETDNSVTNFPDVPVDTWYTGAVTWANENGIVLGRSDTVFDPNTAISRIEMCIIISRYVKYLAAETGKTLEASKDEKTFTDTAELSESYMDALKNCVAYGLIQGYADGTFKPTQGATRAEVATVVARLAAKLEEKKPTTPSVPSWGGTTTTEYTVTYAMPGTSEYDYPVTVKKAAEGDTTYPVLDWDTYAENSDATEPNQQAFADWTDGTNKYTAGDVITLTGNVKLTAEFVSTEDKIFLALQAAETHAKNWYTAKHEAVEKAETTAPTALHYGDVALTQVSVTGTNTDLPGTKRSIYIDGSATIEGLTIEEKVVEIAANVAKGALGETATSAGEYRAQLTKLVKDVAEAIGVKDIDTSSVRNIVDSLYTWGNKEIHGILDDCGLATAIKSMTVTVNGVEATINVDEHTHALMLAGDKQTVAKNLGVALARALYASAKETTEYKSTVELKADITLDFEPADPTLEAYPTVYEVNVKLALSAKDGVLQYYYNDENDTNYIKLTILPDVQKQYSEEINTIVKGVMTGDVISSQIDEVKDTITDTAFADLINALVTFGQTEDQAKATVDKYVTPWIEANLSTTNLNDNVLYNHYWVPNTVADKFADDEFTNTALYGTSATDESLVEEVTNGAVKYFEDQIAEVRQDAVDAAVADGRDGNLAGVMIDRTIHEMFILTSPRTTPEKFEDALATIAQLSGVNIDALKAMDEPMRHFVYAAIIDSHWSNFNNVPNDNVEKTNCYVAMTEYLDDTIAKQISDKLEPTTSASDKAAIGTTLAGLNKLKSIKSISELPIGDLITTLKNVSDLAPAGGGDGGDDDLLQKYGESIINYIQRGANALANRQVTVTITLNTSTGIVTKELTPDELHTLATEKITVLTMLFSNIEGDSGLNLGGRSLSDFAPRTDGTDFCTITIKTANSNTPIKVVPVIEILAQ